MTVVASKKVYLPVSLTALIACYGSSTLAQNAPGAGLIYQELKDKQIEPVEPSVDLKLEGQPLNITQPGGTEVELIAIQLNGNQVFADDRILQYLGDVLNRDYDLAGLQQLANHISLFYRQQGFPFARAVLPTQNLADGVLKITVIEGHYGQITASGESELAEKIQPFLNSLSAGEPIESRSLERAALIIGDLPGIRAVPVMRPGQSHGTGDLDVQVSAGKRASTRFGIDNHGSRYSGEYRARTDLSVNRLLTTGDELQLSALYSSEDTWLGSLNYSLPLGYSGLRGSVGYAHTDYTLGKGFEGYTGTAKISSGSLSYPVIRSQRSNLIANVAYQYKDLDDDTDFADYNKATRSHSVPVSLQFDHRDSFGMGGITYGGLVLTTGKIKVSQTGINGRDYSFSKLNLDLSRIQALGHGLTLFGRVSGQWSDQKGLDSSESFYLGGPNGVRAYPVGEGSDSRGWLAQVELRYNVGAGFSPYLLADAGSTPDGGVDDGDERTVSGAGFGVRYNHRNWTADLVSAWKIEGGDSLSDDRQRDPRVWFSLSYKL